MRHFGPAMAIVQSKEVVELAVNYTILYNRNAVLVYLAHQAPVGVDCVGYYRRALYLGYD
jgi:hypothetical protein